jgi:hypothetical protein
MPRTKTVRPAQRPRPEIAAAQNGHGGSVPPLRSGVTDLAELFAKKTTILAIDDPRDVGKPVRRDTGYRFEIAPRWSPEAQQVVDDYRDQIRRLENGAIDRTDPKLQDALVDQLVAVTKRFWQEPDSPNGIILEGELLTPSAENTRKLITHPALEWLLEALILGYTNRDLFFGARPKTA